LGSGIGLGPGALEVPVEARGVQGVGAHVVGVVNGHPAPEQPRRARRMARVAGEVQRGVAIAVDHVDVGSRVDQLVQAEVEAVVGREVQRGIALACLASEVGTRLDQQLGAPGEGTQCGVSRRCVVGEKVQSMANHLSMPAWQADRRGVLPSVSRKFTASHLSLSNRAISSVSPLFAVTVSRRPT
jgi:hypothetical protein